MQTNAGFVGLANPLGVLMILVAALLLIAMIVFGAGVIRAKEQAGKQQRAALRERLEKKNE